jgi:folate-binding Fe-S cluster repair protein YgfZ
MKTQSETKSSTKSKAVANKASALKYSGQTDVHFDDNRQQAEKITQLQEMANSAARGTVQKVEEEELLQGKFQPIQKKANNTGLPDDLKSGMEKLAGMSLDHVKVHYNSAKPAAVQAHAYAQGSDIHMASGQEKHLPHELGHVVQQAQGRVKPTTTVGGMSVNDNAGLENEATSMGEKALQMKSKVNVNDDAGLESEADIMGAKTR